MIHQSAGAPQSARRPGNHPRRARRLALPGAVLLFLAGSGAGATELQLGSVSLPGKGEVRFETRFSQRVDRPECDIQGRNVDTYSYSGYSICIDLDTIEVAKYGSSLRYHFYVAQGPGMTGGAVHFVVDGEAHGAFLPQMAEVDLFVGEDLATAAPKRIHLPIFSAESPPYLDITPPEQPLKVNFAGSTDLAVALKNQIPWPVTVTGIRPPVGQERNLWREDGAAVLVNGAQVFHEFDLEASSECHDIVALRLRPNPVKAFLAAFFTRNPSREHDTVILTVEHRTRWGGTRSLDVRLPIQFVPWPPLLFLAAAVGALIGSLAALLFGWYGSLLWAKKAGAATVNAVITEFIAMLLVQLDTEVQIFGFRFDPFQLLPALVIGILIGLTGFSSLDLLEMVRVRVRRKEPPRLRTEAQSG